jgi:hypothetical protein
VVDVLANALALGVGGLVLVAWALGTRALLRRRRG